MGFIIYFFGALILHEPNLFGFVGVKGGQKLIEIFGYFAYIIFIPVVYLMLKLYVKTFKQNHIFVFFAVGLLVLGLLMVQSVIIDPPYTGTFGKSLYLALIPAFGSYGVWGVLLFMVLFSVAVLAEKQIKRYLWQLKVKRLEDKAKKLEAQKRESEKVANEQLSSDVKLPQPQIIEEESVDDEEVFDDESDDPYFDELEDEDEIDEDENELDDEDEEEAGPTADEIAFANSLLQLSKLSHEVKESGVAINSLVTTDVAAPKESKIVRITRDSSDEKESAKKESSTHVKVLEENKKLLEDLEFGEMKKPKNFVLPTTQFLTKVPTKKSEVDEGEIDEKIKDLLQKFARFKVEGDVVRTYTGPVVTTFEFKPAPHIKVSRISQLQDDIAMALKAQTIRILAPIPGKDVVGIEIPNRNSETIYLREILESDLFTKSASPLTLALGKDIVGNPFVTDLKKLPHLLIAGTTGSGKSVGINAMILSLLYKNSPDQLRLLLIDPKMLEFSMYNDIPHLLTPVITKAKQAIAALANMVKEMERRYTLMSKTKTKNIDNYNEKAIKEGHDTMPYIVIIIDELADLMMTSGKDVEISIARLAQMARAAGIHLIVATQRPSVDVVTGLIKANLPSRISYRVGQKIDSKVILDQMGAESLLGRGDMLFTPPGSVGVIRLHAPWNTETEIDKIVEFLKKQRPTDYDTSFLAEAESSGGGNDEFNDELDELYEDAKNIVLSEKKTSISYIQRRLQIGYNRAARIVEQLEAMGVLSEQNSKGQREIL